MAPGPYDQDENDTSDLDPSSRSKARGGEVEDSAKGEDRKPKRGEVVVQEELTLHEEEGEVVQRPSDDEERADFVVKGCLGCS